MKPTLLILAAGMGSRYGGVKQLDGFGPNSETIIDYSLYDAIKAGFGKIVFIIREELLTDFKEIFEPKLKGKIEYSFAFQKLESYLPEHLLDKLDRTKPWGTGHAVLCAKDHTTSPFAVINADDFYGYEGFKTMCDYLSSNEIENQQAMISYQLKNTLSENGTVSRGICQVNSEGNLIDVIERTKIIRNDGGEIVFLDNEEPIVLGENTPVSMNFWGFMPKAFETIENMFSKYAEENMDNQKAEFFIPKVISHMIETKTGSCKVFENESAWFGVTYPEDKPMVIASLSDQIALGNYPSKLW